MAFSSRFLLPLLLLSTSICLSNCFILEEEPIGFARRERNLADSSCGPVNCLNGICSGSIIFPFYECTCNEGWKSPLNASWIPCVLPNCSFDLGCDSGSNTSLSAPPPAVSTTAGSFSLCSLPICGNGECVASSNSSLLYECKCNPGSTNLFNVSNGYCIPPCSLGAGCSALGISLGDSPPSPPPPSPNAGQNSSQGTSSSPSSSKQTIPSGGTSQRYAITLVICGFLLLQMGWHF